MQNRVNEIRRNVHPTLEGLTQLTSRGLTALKLSMNRLWREGPEWLKSGTDPLPSRSGGDAMPEECIQELRVTTKSLSLISTKSRNTIEDLMTCQNFSTYLRLLRVTAQVLKAIRGSRPAGVEVQMTRPLSCQKSQQRPKHCGSSAHSNNSTMKRTFSTNGENLDHSRTSTRYGNVEEDSRMQTCLMMSSTQYYSRELIHSLH